MQTTFRTSACFLVLIAYGAATAAEAPRVLVSDSGVETRTIGPGAPPHTVGLQRQQQTFSLDTGSQTFGLRYVVARDPHNAQAAIPGEGYIGMPRPSDCNWYAGGFFDVQLNGRSVGKTFARAVTGRSSGSRGTVDFIFDTAEALVRVRFVALAGDDCLIAQVLLEPKAEIKSVRVAARCYPSAFVSDADRHVLTPTRDIAQGQRADLDVAREWWTLYYDTIFDAGHVSATHRGAGPCAMLWLAGQTEKVGFTVGAYGTDTVCTLNPALRDFRFVFFDYTGRKNEAAKADLRNRAVALREKLTTFAFTDPALANWPLEQKHAEVMRALASLPNDQETAARYERWAKELATWLKLVRSGGPGAIMAETEAAGTIDQWQRGLPTLKLQTLLNSI